MGRLSGRREGLDRGDRGGERAAPTVGQDLGCLKSRGWRRAFTLRSYFQPCPPLLLPLPPRPLPRWHDSAGGTKGAGERRAGDMRDRLGTARAHDPRKSRPRPRNRLQAIALRCRGTGLTQIGNAGRTGGEPFAPPFWRPS